MERLLEKENTMKKLLTVLTCTIALTGCATLEPIPAPQPCTQEELKTLRELLETDCQGDKECEFWVAFAAASSKCR